jgi:hypothetical protein
MMLFTFEIKPAVKIVVIADDSEQSSFLSWAGPTDQVKEVQDFLDVSSGPFGHPVMNGAGMARPGDIDFALTMSDFDWRLTDGTIIEYSSPPEGAVS